MTTLAEFLRGLDNIAEVETIPVYPDESQVQAYHLVNALGHSAWVILVKPDMPASDLVTLLKEQGSSPLLVLVDAPPPEAGATLYHWRENHPMLARLHALFFGKVYYWWDRQVTAVHFTDHNGDRTAQRAPTDRYPFTRLHTSAPHDCFHPDLEGYQWRTMSFGEGVWWETARTSGTGYRGSTYQQTTPPPRRERQSTERPPMSDAEFQEYLRRVREEAQRVYEWTHSPPPVRHQNRYSAALATLGLTSGATPEQIKAAYRAKARQLHPDHNSAPDATRQMQDLNLAYELLMRN